MAGGVATGQLATDGSRRTAPADLPQLADKRPRRSDGRALRSRDEERKVPEKKSRDETKEGPQCRFHGVSKVLETVRISFMAMKRISSLSSQFHAKTDVAPY